VNNPLPIAMGKSLCSWEGILANNRRGRAMETCSAWGDLLCGVGMGFTIEGPNAGFRVNQSYVHALEGLQVSECE